MPESYDVIRIADDEEVTRKLAAAPVPFVPRSRGGDAKRKIKSCFTVRVNENLLLRAPNWRVDRGSQTRRPLRKRKKRLGEGRRWDDVCAGSQAVRLVFMNFVRALSAPHPNPLFPVPGNPQSAQDWDIPLRYSWLHYLQYSATPFSPPTASQPSQLKGNVCSCTRTNHTFNRRLARFQFVSTQ
jgi:hypothetical protein